MHKTKQGALKAARAEMGDDVVEDIDFNLRQTGTGWTHEAIPPANEPAVKAQAKRKASKPKAADKIAAGLKDAIAYADGTADKSAYRVHEPKPVSKSDQIMAMLSTPAGATSKEIETATGWQPHSVRGLLGTWRKKGINVVSVKLKGEPTIYRIESDVV